MADDPLAGAAAAERERQKKKEQQKAHKSAYMKGYRARKAAERAGGGPGAASGAASQTRADTWEERLDVGPGDPGRYTVSRTFVPRPPEPRHTGLQTIVDQEALVDMVLRHFTLEDAKHLLAPVSRQLAASVRDEKVPWKALAEFEFDSEHDPDVETVHELFKQAYPFYRRDELDPYASWLLTELVSPGAYVTVKDKWEIIFDLIPNEGYMPITPDRWGLYFRTPEEVTDAYKRWLANPNRRWDVFNMKTLSDKIERKCLEQISPFCWQSWRDPPRWSPLVQWTFLSWQEKLGFKIDLKKIHTWSILARLDEETFRKVRKIIGRKIKSKSFTNWNQFCFALLKECHNHYMIPEDEDADDDYCDVRGDFERDVGADFEDPDFED